MTRISVKNRMSLILLGHGLIWALLIVGLAHKYKDLEVSGVPGIALFAGLFAISQSFVTLALKR